MGVFRKYAENWLKIRPWPGWLREARTVLAASEERPVDLRTLAITSDTRPGERQHER